ncbi:MAG: glycoside hydrolase family 32 protein [SAR324 cluster bacterium]|nr:glycoside hydrolase family 32 protein [SAR324 cluster bacterium]
MGFDAARHQERIQRVEEHITKEGERIQQHPWREHYHFQAPVGWMNDPHGLIQFNGRFHLFYQYHPFSGKWGTMHWGHAMSDDLIHWEHLPVALAPSEPYDGWDGGGIFTGSAIVHERELLLFYTGCAEDRQVQCLARSKDGVNFVKSDHNPILSEPPKGINPHDFRDPKVWKHGKGWYMVTGVTDGVSNLLEPSSHERNGFGKVCLHHSPDLYNWEFVNYLVESRGELGSMLECPNFFQLDGKWVLMYSPMGLQNRQVIYLTGDFDELTGKFHWTTMGAVDWGFDYYAPQHFQDEQGRNLIMAWIGSWPFMPWCRGQYDTSKLGWYGGITLPRQVSLCSDGKLRSQPASEVEQLRENPRRYGARTIEDNAPFDFEAGDGVHGEILATFDLTESTAEAIGFVLRGSEDQQTLLEFDLRLGEMIFDRTNSGNISAHQRRCLLESASQSQLFVRIFLDSISVEVFTDGGRTTMTNNVFSDPASSNLSVYTRKGRASLRSLQTYGLRSIHSE